MNSLASIKLYGTHTPTYKYFKTELNRHLHKAEIEVPLEEINNISEIISSGIKSIPTININGHVNLSYDNSQPVNDFFRSALTSLLYEYKFGRMKHILVPIDFSDTSINAFIYAKKIAKDINGYITLIHYYHPSHKSMDDGGLGVKKKLEEIAKPNLKFGGTNLSEPFVDVVIKNGFAAEMLGQDSRNCDMIVMGTSGISEGSKKWFGSIAKNAILTAECPVILTPKSATNNGIKKVLYPVKVKLEKMDFVKSFLEKLNPEIHIVHFDENEIHSPMIKEILGAEVSILHSDSHLHVVYKNDKTENVEKGIDSYIFENDIDLLIIEKGPEKIGEFFLNWSTSNKLTADLKFPILVLNQNLK